MKQHIYLVAMPSRAALASSSSSELYRRGGRHRRLLLHAQRHAVAHSATAPMAVAFRDPIMHLCLKSESALCYNCTLES